jgi:hypothetical protein
MYVIIQSQKVPWKLDICTLRLSAFLWSTWPYTLGVSGSRSWTRRLVMRERFSRVAADTGCSLTLSGLQLTKLLHLEMIGKCVKFELIYFADPCFNKE